MVRVLEYDVSEEVYTDAHLLDARRLLDVRLCFGDSLAGKFPSGIRIQIESEAAPNDYFVAGPMPVIGERVKSVLDSFKANVEYFQLDVTLSNGRKAGTPYYYPNILDVIDCLDWDASHYTPEQTYATDVRKLVLRESVMKHHPLFLVARVTTTLICVQEEVATALQEAGCKGIVLESPAEWRNRMYPA
jgi:hypothetical protein